MVLIQMYTRAAERLRDAVMNTPSSYFMVISLRTMIPRKVERYFAGNMSIMLHLEGKRFLFITGSGSRGLGKAPGHCGVFLSTLVKESPAKSGLSGEFLKKKKKG